MKEVIKSNQQYNQVIVVGDATVGKTTALRRLAQRPAVTKAVPTVALEFYAASITIAGHDFRLHFWDTCNHPLIKRVKSATGISFTRKIPRM